MSGESTKKRGVIYARISGSDAQIGNYSLPMQKRLAKEKMEKDGVTEVCEPIEDIESGRSLDRPGLKNLMQLGEL